MGVVERGALNSYRNTHETMQTMVDLMETKGKCLVWLRMIKSEMDLNGSFETGMNVGSLSVPIGSSE